MQSLVEDWAQGFRLGDRLHPWGTRFDALVTGDHTKQGWCFHSLPFNEAYGFATTHAELMAPRLNRPVVQLFYSLAACSAGDDVLTRLVNNLGQPDQISRGEVPPFAAPSGAVVLNATWKHPTTSIGLSIYGAHRTSEFGVGKGIIYLTWDDVEAAGAPFIGAWRRANEAVAWAAVSAHPTVFHLQRPIFDPAKSAESAHERALNAPELLETPATIAASLGSTGFALWQGGDAWFLSTARATVPLGTPDTSIVEFTELAPARGSGSTGLRVGIWAVDDPWRSQTIADAVSALGRVPGLKIEHHEDVDI